MIYVPTTKPTTEFFPITDLEYRVIELTVFYSRAHHFTVAGRVLIIGGSHASVGPAPVSLPLDAMLEPGDQDRQFFYQCDAEQWQ